MQTPLIQSCDFALQSYKPFLISSLILAHQKTKAAMLGYGIIEN
jgi:hypothetical protein